MKTRKTAYIMLSLIIVLSTIVGAGTFSLLRGTAQNDNNEMHAGSINLSANRAGDTYVPGPMFYPDALDTVGKHPYDVEDRNPSGEAKGGWAPGDSVTRYMNLSNDGTLDAKIAGLKATPRATYTHLAPGGLSSTFNGLTAGEAYEEFISKAHVLVKAVEDDIVLYDGLLKDLIFEDENQYAPITEEFILPGVEPPFEFGPLELSFTVTLDQSAGNSLQEQNFIFDFGLKAEQARNNNGGEEPELENGIASGYIFDAVTGNGIGNLALYFRADDDPTRAYLLPVGEDGHFYFELPEGTYTGTIGPEGYIETDFTLTVVGNTETANQNIALSPVLNEGQTRIVLTWGANPSDLDSHLTGPTEDGGRFHVYYGNDEYYENGVLVASLDHDDTSSYGPETTTVTVNHTLPGDYNYFVYHYSGAGSLAESDAEVKVYRDDTLIQTFSVPAGEGRYWNVFKMNGDTITPVNSISDTSLE